MKRSRLRPAVPVLTLARQLLAAYFSTMLWHGIARALQFQHATFDSPDDIANITFVKQGVWYNGPNAYYRTPAIWLTADRSGPGDPKETVNLGRIVYKNPIQLIDNKEEANRSLSFNTSFSFQIVTTASYGAGGSGMAFFMSNSEQAPEDSDKLGALGLVNPKVSPAEGTAQFFAVEFDTRQSPNYEDPSASHIGIDINSMISSNFTDTSPGSSLYPQLYLYNNSTFTVWIEYSASSSLIQVWMTNISSHHRPLQPCLQLHYDLSSFFQKPILYVGFSATNYPKQEGTEAHAIYSWNFSSYEPFLYTSNCKSCRKIKSKLLLAVAPPCIFSAVAVCGVFIYIVVKRHMGKDVFSPSNDNNNIVLALSTVPRYSYRQLRKAAHGFDDKNKVGEGGFSSVYKATLADGSTVAVKKLKEGLRKEAEFCAEISIISSIRHRNLLQLQGWCYEKGEAMLVYQYMTRGSLDSYLFGKKKGTLQRETRFRILIGMAAALEYLHGGLGDCVLHRDVKAANVLLTEDFEPMLSDFGLARLISHNQAVSMTVAGTPGYVAPEVIYTGRATDKADVYSFGVLALELACGRRAMDGSLQPQELCLVDWVWLLHESNKLIEALDPSIQMDMPASEEQRWRCVLHVALMCYHPSPESRPTMRQVTQALQDTVLILLPTTKPGYPYATGPCTVSRANKTLHQFFGAMLPSSEIRGSSSSTIPTLGGPSVSPPPSDSEILSPR